MGMKSGTAAGENTMVVSLKIKNRTTVLYNPAISHLGMYSKGWKPRSQRTISTPMLKVALFTIAKTWDHPKSPQTDEWISKMQYRHSMKYQSGINSDTCHNMDEF